MRSLTFILEYSPENLTSVSNNRQDLPLFGTKLPSNSKTDKFALPQGKNLFGRVFYSGVFEYGSNSIDEVDASLISFRDLMTNVSRENGMLSTNCFCRFEEVRIDHVHFNH